MDKEYNDEIEQRRKEKRDSILAAALKAYCTYGISGAKVQDIADMAGIGKSTVYEYFKSKEELEKAVVYNFLFNEGNQMFESVQDMDEKPLESLVILVNGAIDNSQSYGEIFMVYIEYIVLKVKRENRNMSGIMKEEFGQIIDQFVGVVKRLLDKCLEKGQIQKDIDTEQFAMLVITIIDLVGFYAMVFDKEKTKLLGEGYKDIIFHRLGVDPDKVIKEMKRDD